MTLARLLIHASDAVGEGGRVLPLFVARLRAWVTPATRRRRPTLVGLRVADLQGRQFFFVEGLLPVIDVPLPAGTYHVTVSQGLQQRRYTVALEQGATVDLHLRGTPDDR